MDELKSYELDEIEARANFASPGPWFEHSLDDAGHMRLRVVTIDPDMVRGAPWPKFDPGAIVAATLVQEPRYVDIRDERSEDNALFIAHARSDIPRLIAEIRRLRAQEKPK